MAALVALTVTCTACGVLDMTAYLPDTQAEQEQNAGIAETIPAEYTLEAIAERAVEEVADQAATEADETADEASTEAATEAATEALTEDAADTEEAEETGSNGYLVVLDPGHSSKVSGNTEPLYPGSSEMKAADAIGTHGDASGLMEYQLVLTVCEKAAAALEAEGYEVLLTRTDSDHTISCAERAQIANNAGADAYIRVHANGVDDTSVAGAMTICVTENNPNPAVDYADSARLSEVLLDEYIAATGRRKEYVWYTDTMTGNNWAEVPTTLLEMGYMTNADEDLWMASEAGQQQIVTGIVNGLNAYFGLS